jgi:hypothetical protein
MRELIKHILKEETDEIFNFFRRRFTPEEINDAFKSVEDYVNKLQWRSEMSESGYLRVFTSILMDEFHGVLSNWGTSDFEYVKTANMLGEVFKDKIIDSYHKNN